MLLGNFFFLVLKWKTKAVHNPWPCFSVFTAKLVGIVTSLSLDGLAIKRQTNIRMCLCVYFSDLKSCLLSCPCIDGLHEFNGKYGLDGNVLAY